MQELGGVHMKQSGNQGGSSAPVVSMHTLRQGLFASLALMLTLIGAQQYHAWNQPAELFLWQLHAYILIAYKKISTNVNDKSLRLSLNKQIIRWQEVWQTISQRNSKIPSDTQNISARYPTAYATINLVYNQQWRLNWLGHYSTSDTILTLNKIASQILKQIRSQLTQEIGLELLSAIIWA